MTRSLLIIVFGAILLYACQNNTQKVKNIEAFAKVYGYARWFHPSDESQKIDWDRFAIYGVKKVENLTTTQDLRDTLTKLFSPFVNGLNIYDSKSKQLLDFKKLIPSDCSDKKVVAWQHSGVGLVDDSSPYRSVRTNIFNEESESVLSTYIVNVSDFKGKEIKICGNFKVTSGNSIGKVLFYLQPGLTNGGEFSDLSNCQAEIITNQWKRYDLRYKVSHDVTNINIGISMTGNVSFKSEFLQIYLKEHNKWKLYTGSNIEFKPKNTNGVIEGWREDRTLHSFEVIDSEFECGKYAIKSELSGKLFENCPAFGETINEPIGMGLYCQMPLSLYGDGIKTLPVMDVEKITTLQQDINNIKIDKFKNNKYTNLGSVVIAWNVFQHFYPYFDVINTDWRNVLYTTLDETFQNNSYIGFYKTISKMVAKLKDGHGYVKRNEMWHIQVRTEFIENEIVVTASEDKLLKIGDVIKSVNGVDAIELQTKTEELVSGSPQLKKYRALNIFGSSFYRDNIDVEVERNGESMEFEIELANSCKNLFQNSINNLKYCRDTIIEIKPGVLYVNTRFLTYENFKQNIDRIANAQSVIYDFRWGQKFSPTLIIQYLIDEPVKSPWIIVPYAIYPDRREVVFRESNWPVTPKLPRFKSKSIFINNPGVVSSIETAIGFVDNYKLGTTVGSTTAGCNGVVNYINLPNGCEIMWTGMKVLKHDRSQHHLVGFEPDYPVSRTLKGVKEGRDEVLEKAIEVAKSEVFPFL